jgi:hypothetical protein
VGPGHDEVFVKSQSSTLPARRSRPHPQSIHRTIAGVAIIVPHLWFQRTDMKCVHNVQVADFTTAPGELQPKDLWTCAGVATPASNTSSNDDG